MYITVFYKMNWTFWLPDVFFFNNDYKRHLIVLKLDIHLRFSTSHFMLQMRMQNICHVFTCLNVPKYLFLVQNLNVFEYRVFRRLTVLIKLMGVSKHTSFVVQCQHASSFNSHRRRSTSTGPLMLVLIK